MSHSNLILATVPRNADGNYTLSFPNYFELVFKKTLYVGKPEGFFKVWLRAYHEQSGKVIDLPNPVSLRLVHDNNPLLDVTEPELAYLIDEVRKFKKLEGEWTNGLVKQPRHTSTALGRLNNLYSSFIREELTRPRLDNNFWNHIERDDSWGGSVLTIPVMPDPRVAPPPTTSPTWPEPIPF